MNAIVPPINSGDTGEAVTKLREALLLLLQRGALKALAPPNSPTSDDLKALVTEIRVELAANEPYGGAAQKAVFFFQLRNGLGDNLVGLIEQSTADLLNRLLKEFGGLDDPKDYVVEGRIVDEKGQGIPGIPVRLFEEDVTGPLPIGELTKTLSNGQYRFSFATADYLEGDYGEFVQPGTPRMAEPGRFMAAYAPRFIPPVTLRVPSGPDLWVGVGEDVKEPLARTEIVFNVGPHTFMPDLELKRTELHKGLSDLERVLGLVVPRLKGLALTSLSTVQIEFLAKDCEEPLSLVKALVTAARSEELARKLAAEVDLAWTEAADLLLALQFTMNVEQESAGLEQLLQLVDEIVERTLQGGIERNHLPKSIAPMIPGFVPWLAGLRARHRLSSKSGEHAQPLGPILATLPDGIRLKDEALLGVAHAFDFWGRDPERFEATLLKAGLDQAQTLGVMRTLSLSNLTAGHLSLIKLLQTDNPTPEHAALLDLAALDRTKWNTVVEKAGLPPGVEDQGVYITGLIRSMERRAPTAYMMARIEDGRIAFDATLLNPSRIFAARNPDFRFGSDSVFTRFGQQGALDDVTEDQVQPLLQELLRVERVARAAPNLEAAEIVLSRGYGSAYEITKRKEDDFIEELKLLLPDGEAEARAIYEAAQGIVESAFAIYLALSPQANGAGQVQLLSGTAPQGTTATATPMSTTSAMTTTGAAAQAATLAVLFGNQDACACEPCSAMGSPSHYLAELLNFLDSDSNNISGNGVVLGKLLERRPDLQEIVLDCDNANHVMPYIDLLLELIEAPLIEKSLLLPRSTGPNATDPLPNSNPQVPPTLVGILREHAGIDIDSSATAVVRSTQPQQSWLIKGGDWRLLLTTENTNKYRIRVFPQSGRGALPESWGYPAQMLDLAYAPLTTARYPWTLPFDLAEAETDVWLGVLGTSVRAVAELRAGAALSSNDLAARLALRLADGEWTILTSATTAPWLDWGYTSENVQAGNATVSWHQALSTVSTFKQRAGITHLELLELIQCRFIQQAATVTLGLAGDECDSDKMQLTPLQTQHLRRIHLFIRLWRRLGWPMRDLDRALSYFQTPTVGNGNAEVLNTDFLRHLAGVVRLCERTSLEPQLALALFNPSLDTQTYWRQDGTRALAIPSTYDRLFTDPALNRPRAPAFELNLTRNGLVRNQKADEFPMLRLSDHVAVIAGALGCTAADVLALLPQGEVSIAPQALATNLTGRAVKIPESGNIVIEIVLGTTSPINQAATVTLSVEAPAGNSFSAIPASELVSTQGLTMTLPVAGWSVHRFAYTPSGTRAQHLRAQVAPTSGSTTGIWLAARILTTPGLVVDELTLENLSLLARHLVMARACKLNGSDYRKLLDLLGMDPLQSSANAVDFLEHIYRSRSLGLPVEILNELLCEQFVDAQTEQRAHAQVCQALEAVRAVLAAQEAELNVEPGQAEATLRKALLEVGWPQRLVDLVISADMLDPSFETEHKARLDLPRLASDPLPMGLSYSEEGFFLQFSAPLADAINTFKTARKELEQLLQGDAIALNAVAPALDELSTSVDNAEVAVRKHAAGLLQLAQSFELSTFEVSIDAQYADAFRAVRIPEAWADTLWFDGARRKLCYKGPMTATWRDELSEISTQAEFTSAIDTLYNRARSFIETANQSLFDPPNIDGAYNLITRPIRGPEQRAGELLQRVMPMLRVRRAALRVAALLEPRLGLAAPVLTALLERYRHNSSGSQLPLVGQGIDQGILLKPDFIRSPIALRVTPQGFPLRSAALRRVFKLATLARAARLDRQEIDWLVGPWPSHTTSAPGTILNLAALLPTTSEGTLTSNLRTAWSRFTAALAARQRLGNEPGALTGYLMASTQTSVSDAVRAIAEWAGIVTQNAERLVTNVVGVSTGADMRDPARLLHLVGCLDWIRKTRCDVESMLAWSAPQLSMVAASRARQLARARLGEAAWKEASQKPLDELRLKRRDALVTHEVHRQGLADTNALYGRLLVDPEMGPCMQTTRTRLAISSVQLFVQRIQLGLEEGNGLARDAVNARQWDWMQNYRMWEANLIVLLRSENYIDMSLRRTKTPPYRALEADLMQGDINAQRASAALTTYLDELEEVSRLETVGMYRDTPERNGLPAHDRQTLYFVGATRDQPKKHFLRKYVRHGIDVSNGTWTPWERIDLDLQSSDYVYLHNSQGELWLTWLDIREQTAEPRLSQGASPVAPSKFWNVTLRWSRRKEAGWTPPKSYELSKSTFMLSSSQRTTFILLAPSKFYSGVMEYDFIQARANSGIVQLAPSGLYFEPSTSPLRTPVEFREPCYYFSKFWNPTVNADGQSYPIFATPSPEAVQTLFAGLQEPHPISLFPWDDIQFNAPTLDRPDNLAASFMIDTGYGEGLAQPKWQYDVELRIATDKSYLRLIKSPTLVVSLSYHPQIQKFASTARSSDLAAFFSLNTQQSSGDDWLSRLNPNALLITPKTRPDFKVDFSLNASYAAYNWELFFMIPFAVACELSKQQRFREARDWFHYVFDPTSADTSSPSGQPLKPGQQFWKFLPFRQLDGTASIQALIHKLADAADQSQEKTNFLTAIAKWQQEPFDPHLVAWFRPVAYQMAVVMAYLRNLISWADQLFRRDTMESLNEATQLYILAAEIIGRPRELIPPRTRRIPLAFAELKAAMAGNAGALALSNPLVVAESVLPLNVPGAASNVAVPRILHFCVPPNPAFEELRQTVQDRLFKMRNCMNIDGVERQLALFEPPIDPAMLVKARAAGIDVAALLAESSAPPPVYRFNVLAQKASEVCSDVKSLGAALLAAMEKGDGESLARLRSEHELQILAGVRQVKQLQIDEAEAAIKALDPSLEAASRRLHHYLNLLTQVEELTVPTGAAGPTIGSLLVAAVNTITTVGTVASVVAGATNPLAAAAGVALNQAISRATEALSDLLASNDASTSKVPMNPAERNQLIEMGSARASQNKANDLRLVAQLFAKIPDFKAGFSGISSPVVTAELGGSLLSSAASFLATMEDARASEHSHRASLHGMLANYQRRAADWMQQALQAKSDIEQISRQMAAAALRVAIAAQDLRNHDLQMVNATQVDEWYRTKYTNQELYSWMSQQVSGVYMRSYQLAYDLAKRAERAYQHELGLERSDFIRQGHWDGLKKGLLAGDLLYHDIKRMESAYLDANTRELEITRSISLRQLDVAALMKLRAEGQCGFQLPEWLFNMDYPDHYMRRIKSVTVSLPCVVGPYTGISGKLTMLSGKVRTKPVPGVSYTDEANFRESQLAASSIAISTAQGDSGLFEFNLRDERFLPFEGAGLVDSRWQFELPSHVKQFDYETITDLVLTVRYTARASMALRADAIANLNSQLASTTAQALLIDLKRDFPAVWGQAVGALRTGAPPISLNLTQNYFPYAWARRAAIAPNQTCFAWIKIKGTASSHLIRTTATVDTSTATDGTNWTLRISAITMPTGLPQGSSALDELLLSVGFVIPDQPS
ncbi:MAG: hypothetical protein IN818_08125 [Cutibacterium sp.]|nr:hypothetical protein [Cutibacterium sp.]